MLVRPGWAGRAPCRLRVGGLSSHSPCPMASREAAGTSPLLVLIMQSQGGLALLLRLPGLLPTH